jgi:hypothetical protein
MLLRKVRVELCIMLLQLLVAFLTWAWLLLLLLVLLLGAAAVAADA